MYNENRRQSNAAGSMSQRPVAQNAARLRVSQACVTNTDRLHLSQTCGQNADRLHLPKHVSQASLSMSPFKDTSGHVLCPSEFAITYQPINPMTWHEAS